MQVETFIALVPDTDPGGRRFPDQADQQVGNQGIREEDVGAGTAKCAGKCDGPDEICDGIAGRPKRYKGAVEPGLLAEVMYRSGALEPPDSYLRTAFQ